MIAHGLSGVVALRETEQRRKARRTIVLLSRGRG
jgi:hypothetical protein